MLGPLGPPAINPSGLRFFACVSQAKTRTMRGPTLDQVVNYRYPEFTQLLSLKKKCRVQLELKHHNFSEYSCRKDISNTAPKQAGT